LYYKTPNSHTSGTGGTVPSWVQSSVTASSIFAMSVSESTKFISPPSAINTAPSRCKCRIRQLTDGGAHPPEDFVLPVLFPVGPGICECVLNMEIVGSCWCHDGLVSVLMWCWCRCWCWCWCGCIGRYTHHAEDGEMYWSDDDHADRTP
jgi:hypothetical protein